MSISAGAMETTAEFLQILRVKALSEVWLIPKRFGLSGELPWNPTIWGDIRWALSHFLGIREEHIDSPPPDGLVVYDGNWLLKAGELEGQHCLKLVRINQPA